MRRLLPNEQLEPLIFQVREHRVVLDADLARLYRVDTKRFNEAFKRNRARFPADFAFRLTTAEFDRLRSRLAPTIRHPADSLGHMWSQFATTSRRRYGHRAWVFTEHGALMAANILRSEHAVTMSVEQVAANTAVLKRLAEIDKTLLQHDSALREPADPPKRRIGFHREAE